MEKKEQGREEQEGTGEGGREKGGGEKGKRRSGRGGREEDNEAKRIKKTENKNDHEPAEGMVKKDGSKKPPDLAAKKARRIQIKHADITRIEPNEQENECVEPDHNPDQPRNGDESDALFKFIQPTHVRRQGREAASIFKCGSAR